MNSLVLSPTAFANQPRQRAMARRLALSGPVTIASNGRRPSGYDWIEVPDGNRARSLTEKLRILAEAVFRWPHVGTSATARTEAISGIDLDRFDLVTVHDLDVLAAVLDRPRSCAVLFDARELYPEERADQRSFRFLHAARLRRHCRQLFARCDAVITVSEGISDIYEQLTGIRPDVVTSAKERRVAPPPAPRSADFVRILYHGGVNGDRSLATLIELADMLDERFHLDMYLVGDPAERERLRSLASATKRCSIKDSVPSDALADLGAEYDIGLVLYEARNRNLSHCMPNKLFEYIQSHLAVVCGPLSDAGRLVTSMGFGVALPTTAPAVVADALNCLSRSDIDAMRSAAFAASFVLNADREDAKANKVIERALLHKRNSTSVVRVAV